MDLKKIFIKFKNDLLTSYWSIPTMWAISLSGLAVFAVHLDFSLPEKLLSSVYGLYGGGVEGARQIFSTIASSMITVAGVVFSITIVALTLAVSQYGPRVLSSFMGDRGTQHVQGIFIGTFLYSVLSLAMIGSYSEGATPHLSLTLGLVLVFIATGGLIFYLHHSARMIQISTLIIKISEDAQESIAEAFPKKIGESKEIKRADQKHSYLDEDQIKFDHAVKSHESGYVSFLRDTELMELANKHNLVIKLNKIPGSFVVQGESLWVYSADGEITVALKEEIEEEANKIFVMSVRRSYQQDIEFPINQLVEIALRALSPGVNDPFTAVLCIDYLTVLLCDIVERKAPDSMRYNEEGRLKIVAEYPDFISIFSNSFDQILLYGKKDDFVRRKLIEAVRVIQSFTPDALSSEILSKYLQKVQSLNE